MYKKIAEESDLDAARVYVEQGNSSEIVKLLCETIYYENEELFHIVLPKVVDVNEKSDEHWWTPLHTAIEVSNLNFVKELINKNANVNAQIHNGFTPLHHAVDSEADGAWQMQVEPVPIISKYLLENGADANLANDEGRTAIDMARDYEYQAFLDLL